MSYVIRVHAGVQFNIIAPAGFKILSAVQYACDHCFTDAVLTSACDGVHSGPDDPHHKGEAFDFRSHDYSEQLKRDFLATILSQLDPLHFYGFLESPGTLNEHFHIQRRKGTIYP